MVHVFASLYDLTLLKVRFLCDPKQYLFSPIAKCNYISKEQKQLQVYLLGFKQAKLVVADMREMKCQD